MTGDQQQLKQQLERIAHAAVEGVRRRGVEGVRARAVGSRASTLTYRDGRPERVEEAARRRLSLNLYVDGRYSSCETNDLVEADLEAFLDTAVALARAVEVDPDRVMSDPTLYEGRQELDLGLFDPAVSRQGPEDRHSYAAALEQAVRDQSGDVVLLNVEAKYQDSDSVVVQVHSNGFEGADEQTQLWAVAEVALRDEGDRRPSGVGVAGDHHLDGLAPPREVARRALESARAKLGARPIETASLPLIIENRAVPRLLRSLLGPLGGRMIQQRASFLEGLRGESVGSARLDLVDDPFVVGGFGSRLFDGEGLAARRLPLFEQGLLRSYYLDTYYARKLGEAPTTGSSSNVVITPGERGLEAMIGDLERGVLVRGFIGGNSNSTTGDFSHGVFGTMIEGGQLTHAVSEMNIAGNHRELWTRLIEVGADVYPYSSIRSPSLLFESVQLAGR